MTFFSWFIRGVAIFHVNCDYHHAAILIVFCLRLSFSFGEHRILAPCFTFLLINFFSYIITKIPANE